MTLSGTWPFKVRSENYWRSGLYGPRRKGFCAAGKRERQKAKVLTIALLNRRTPTPPVTVTLVRIAPRKLDEDNLQGGCKHIRDGIRDAIGLDDSPDSGVEWVYDQERGAPKQYAMRISVEW